MSRQRLLLCRRLCSELRFAPLVQKSTSHRATEFETHLYRIDVSLKGHIPPFVPNGTRAALINWARLARYTAEKRWKAQRSIINVTQHTHTPFTPATATVTSTNTASDTAVEDADAYEASEIFLVENHTGRCFNCDKTGHWSRDCKHPRKPRTADRRLTRRPTQPGSTRKPAPREPARRPLAITDRTVKVTKGTLHTAHDPGNDSDPQDDDIFFEREVVEILGDESARESDYLTAPVMAADD